MIIDKVATDTIPVWKAKIIEKENIKELLDKIRAEIEETIQEETVVNMNGGEYEHTESKIDSYDVLQIIDKYKKEQTEADNTCSTCTHSDETDGSNCYECVKGKSKYEADKGET